MPDSLVFLLPDLRDALARDIVWQSPTRSPGQARDGLVTLDDFLFAEVGEPVGGHGMTRLRRFAFGRGDARRVGYLKVYDYTRRPWRHRFIRDKARREADNYAALRQHGGMAVPAVVCFGARRRLGALVGSFILTLEAAGARPLIDWWESSGDGGDSQNRDIARAIAPRSPGQAARRAALLASTPAQIARMHAAGFVHVDLQWRNLLVLAEPGRPPELVPLDCARGGLRQTRIGRAHGRLRDLSSLLKDAQSRLTRTQMMRWYLDYAAALHGTASIGRCGRAAG
jgi:hypothetical protein